MTLRPGAYIGQLGRLVPLPYVSSQSVEAAERFTFETTLEGRVKAQARPVQRRSWSVSGDRYLAEAQGTLLSFAAGEWGFGPFVWVSADAQVTNLYTPAVASCDPVAAPSDVTVAGPMPLGDGSYAGRSYMPSGQYMFFGAVGDVPVLPGVPVTGSAYVLGAGAAARVSFYDSAGLVIGSPVTSTVTATAGTPVRSYVTATPPANAVSALVSTVNATQAARPASTWTDRLFAWADGQGCPKAVVHALAKDIQSAHFAPGGQRAANISFTIQEVG